MSKLACFFGIHDYQPIWVNHGRDTSYGGDVLSTQVTYFCETCSTTKSKYIYGCGHLPIEVFKKGQKK